MLLLNGSKSCADLTIFMLISSSIFLFEGLMNKAETIIEAISTLTITAQRSTLVVRI